MLSRSVFPMLALLLAPSLLCAQSPAKRPLTHADYDIWSTISGMTLSPDGKFAAYTVSAGRGNATFVVRNIATGAEFKFARGNAPTPAAGPEVKDEFESEEEEADQIRGGGGQGGGGGGAAGIAGGPSFTPDSKSLFFVLTPTSAELEKAKADKKKPEEIPRAVLAVLDLSTGQIKERIGGIRSFSIVGNGAGLLVLVKDPKPEIKTENKLETLPIPKQLKDASFEESQEPQRPQEPQRGQEPKLPVGASPLSPVGNDLIIKNLADGREVTFADVQDYSITREFRHIAYTVASKKSEANGVYYADLAAANKTETLIKGAGRYYRLSWDDKQTQLAFFFDDTPSPATPAPPTGIPDAQTPRAGGGGTGGKGGRRGAGGGGASGAPGAGAAANVPALPNAKPRVYLWQRTAKDAKFSPAVLILGPATPGLKKGWQIVDRGGLGFSADGLKLNVSVAPEPEKAPEPKKVVAAPGTPGAPAADRVDLDLWHWKDEVIQPMQKIRAAQTRNRSYQAVYLLDSKTFRHLADEDRTLRAPDFGDWGVGQSDKKYRFQSWESPVPSDYALVNIRTGDAKPILTAARSGLSPSPKEKYLAGFDGRDWFTISVPEGKKTVLTQKLATKFFNEDSDTPQITGPYPQIGWSSDEKHFYVSDRHDIWKLAPDGSGATNVTQIGAPTGIRFKFVRAEKPEEEEPAAERERGIDDTVPWLLAAENLKTRDTGFYRLEPGQTPKLLLMGPRNYGVPAKAKKADTMIMTVSTFTDFPDYYTTTAEFKEIRRLTDANSAKRAEFNWAKAELIHYASTDGTPLSGILVKPEDFDPAKKYPMVVYIYERLTPTFHGYKSPVVTRGQVINPIWYASNGYLVLMPDIAYKIGQPGQSAMHCVMPAIQAVVDRGCVNEKAIGINGQSWGGYQIAYMVTQTDRFKAAVAGAAVSDMVSAYNGIRWGTGMARQFQYERTQSRIGETLWQAPMKYIENSPVFMADRVRTPLVLINNDADDAVPWYQGIEFYLSLRRLGREVYMFNYNGEPHNLAKTVNARDFALRMQQFFDHELKGAPMPEWMAKGIPFLDREKEKEQWKKLFSVEEKAK